MTIPQPKPGERGWSVEPNGTIHLRYQDHAPGAVRVATEKGVLTVLGDTAPVTCKECFPHKIKTAPNLIAQRGQQRRV